MKRNTLFLVIISVLLLHLTLFAQQNNGNLFEKSWAVDPSMHRGTHCEMGAYAPEGLDIDQDGFREFLVYDTKREGFLTQQFDRLQLWENRGNNDFYLAWQIIYKNVQDQYKQGAGLTVADLDMDGKQEVLMAAEMKIYIYEWDGTQFESGAGLPQVPTLILDPVQDNLGQANVRTLIVKNLDADPDLEIFMGYHLNAGMFCVIGSLEGSDLSNPDWKPEFADDFHSAEAPPGGGYRVGGVVIDDFDEDGKMEIFAIHWQDVVATRVYENDGVDNYMIKHTNVHETFTHTPPFDGSFANPVFYDFDGDGDREFLINDVHGHIFVITKDASNGFEDFGPSAWSYIMTWPDVPDGGYMRSGYLGDLDQDGKPDIYYSDFRIKAVLDLEYQGGPLTDPNSWIAYEIYKDHPSRCGNVRPVGDLDGDGRYELVVNMIGEQGWSNLYVLESMHESSAVKEWVSRQIQQFSLHQNYPNPFNPTTEIWYELGISGYVRLEVYSVLGQKVSTLVDGFQNKGVHKVAFNAIDLPTDVYMYRLSSNYFTDQKKMILLK